MTSTNIENYVQSWTKAPALHRLFADLLTTEPRFAIYKPEAAFQKDGWKASDVAGALSSIVVGIGWKRVKTPSSLVKFEACPVSFATFATNPNFLESRFYFPIASNVHANRSGLISFVLSKEKTKSRQIEYVSPNNQFPDIDNELKTDNLLSELIGKIELSGLVYTPLWVGQINYGTIGESIFGSFNLKIEQTKKKWCKAIQETNLTPQDFVENLFNVACSIAGHVKKYADKL